MISKLVAPLPILACAPDLYIYINFENDCYLDIPTLHQTRYTLHKQPPFIDITYPSIVKRQLCCFYDLFPLTLDLSSHFPCPHFHSTDCICIISLSSNVVDISITHPTSVQLPAVLHRSSKTMTHPWRTLSAPPTQS